MGSNIKSIEDSTNSSNTASDSCSWRTYAAPIDVAITSSIDYPFHFAIILSGFTNAHTSKSSYVKASGSTDRVAFSSSGLCHSKA